MNKLQVCPNYTSTSILNSSKNYIDDHALLGISTFNSYFSIENMKKMFFWANNNFANFNIFVMDGASVFNLRALGYSESDALKKTKKHDRNLQNKINRCLISIGFSEKESQKKILCLSHIIKNERYLEIHKKCERMFHENLEFRKDCLNATRAMLLEKVSNLSEESVLLAIQYLIAELPLWFDTAYILSIDSSTVIYKDLSLSWKKICYNYNLMSPKQKILIKHIE